MSVFFSAKILKLDNFLVQALLVLHIFCHEIIHVIAVVCNLKTCLLFFLVENV